MRILNYCTSIAGGAGRAVLNLNKALRENGIDSWIASRDNPEKQPFVIRVEYLSSIEQNAVKKLNLNQEKTLQSRTSISNTLFSTDFVDFDFMSSELIRSFDIHHLHWTVGFVHPSTVALMLRMGMNVVWTLHDMWPITGGCHYSAGCKKYEDLCTECPQLYGEARQNIPALHASRTAFLNSPRLIVNAPSQWLSNVAKTSRALSNCQHICVHNSVNKDDFKPATQQERYMLRQLHGIDDSSIVLTCITQNFGEQRKGFSMLAQAVNHVKHRNINRKIKIAVVGHQAERFNHLGTDIINFGQHTSNINIRNSIIMADFVVQLAIEENYSNVIMESLACGVPVIASKAGGNTEIISDAINGYIFDHETDTVHLESILYNLLMCEEIPNFSDACLARAEADSPANVASHFISEICKILPHLKEKITHTIDSSVEAVFKFEDNMDFVLKLPHGRIRLPTKQEFSRLNHIEKNEIISYLSCNSEIEDEVNGKIDLTLEESSYSLNNLPLLNHHDQFLFSDLSRKRPETSGLKSELFGSTIVDSPAVISFRTSASNLLLLLTLEISFYDLNTELPTIKINADGYDYEFKIDVFCTIEIPLSTKEETHCIKIFAPMEFRASDGVTKRLGRLFLICGELMSSIDKKKSDVSKISSLSNNR